MNVKRSVIAMNSAECTTVMVESGTGVTLRTVRWGNPAEASAVPLVLIHGLASNALLWEGAALEFAALGHAVVAVLTTSGRGIRPTELVEVLVPESDPPINPWDHLNRVLRINQWIERDGERVDVLTGRPAHPQVCA